MKHAVIASIVTVLFLGVGIGMRELIGSDIKMGMFDIGTLYFVILIKLKVDILAKDKQ